MNRTDALRRVRALLNKADSTPYEAERESLRAKADSIMTAHAVEEWQLKQEGGEAEKPTTRKFQIIGADNPYWSQIADLAHRVGEHARCRVVTHGLRLAKSDGKPVDATFVGFPADVEYAEVLFTSLHLQLANEMEPEYDAAKSDYENLTDMRAAGLPWDKVLRNFGIDCPEHGQNKHVSECRKLIHGWRKWLKENKPDAAKDLLGNNPASYRRSYVVGFVSEVSRRFSDMKRQQEEAGETTGTNALALRDREQEVDEALRNFFPRLSAPPAPGSGTTNASGYSRGKVAGSRADLSGGRGGLGGQRKGLPS